MLFATCALYWLNLRSIFKCKQKTAGAPVGDSLVWCYDTQAYMCKYDCLFPKSPYWARHHVPRNHFDWNTMSASQQCFADPNKEKDNGKLQFVTK